MLKIAMFDEVNESTAMFKVAAHRLDAPDQGYWLTLDADGFTLPSDWYLRLAGEITRIFHGESHGQSVAAAAVPATPGPPWADSGIVVVSAASFNSGTLAPDAIATAGGEGLGGSTSVDIIDSTGLTRAATVFYVSAVQVNFAIPAGTAGGNATIVFAKNDGTAVYGGTRIASVAPGLFSADSNGTGVAAGVFRVFHADGTVSSGLTFSCADVATCTATPIALGAAEDQVVLELYGTGIRGRSSLNNVRCTIGGVPATVLYAGAQGQYPGLDQVNVSVPRALTAGPVEIALTVDGIAANKVTVAIR
jgi:uncharacterized protein (TIGR03437 family)